MGRDSFIIYTSFYKPISSLSDKQLGKLFRAIFRYNLGEVVSVEEDIGMAFGFFKNQFDIDENKYRARIMRDIENGRKGGNPNFKKGKPNPYYKKAGTEITQDNPPLSKITQDNPINDNVNDNDSFPVETEKEIPPNGGTKKKTKRKHRYAPLVLLADDEYASLVAQYGESGVQWMIKKLDDYKAARGMTYKSDYRAILNWVVGEYEKRNYGRNTENRRNTADVEKQFRDKEFAEHIAKKLTGD